jgi:anti-anti-sigma factor
MASVLAAPSRTRRPIPARLITHPDALSPVLRGGPVHLDGSLVYALDGELDLAAADAFHRRVAQLAPVPGGGPVVLDFSKLSFIDCGGLRALCQLHEALRALGGPGLVVRKMQPQVRKVFDLAGASEFVTVVG